MSLANRLANLRPSQVGNPCGVGLVLKKLPEEDKKVLEMVLAVKQGETGRLSNGQVRQALEDEGYVIALASVITHRVEKCRCFRGLNPTLNASKIDAQNDAEFSSAVQNKKARA